MNMEPPIARRIVRNALLSVFLYALPVLLMFATFFVTGQRPWEKKAKEKARITSHTPTPHATR